uniref:WKF domain-containing protein n=1 Tax=Graphocephala atropunctata TaxID=36148 RepID=A0A1B6K8L3_9HEMI
MSANQKKKLKRQNKMLQPRSNDGTQKKGEAGIKTFVKSEPQVNNTQIGAKRKKNRNRKNMVLQPQPPSDDDDDDDNNDDDDNDDEDDDSESTEETPKKKIKLEPSKVSSEVKNKKNNQKKKAVPVIFNKVNISCIEYLKKWRSDRKNWKFSKPLQSRLVRNMFNEEKLPDELFQPFLEYLAGGTPALKNFTKTTANQVIASMEKWNSLSEEEKEKEPKLKVDESKYDRARNLLQYLE